jgi:hypothetical protein
LASETPTTVGPTQDDPFGGTTRVTLDGKPVRWKREKLVTGGARWVGSTTPPDEDKGVGRE